MNIPLYSNFEHRKKITAKTFHVQAQKVLTILMSMALFLFELVIKMLRLSNVKTTITLKQIRTANFVLE